VQLADAELGPLIKMRLQSVTRPEINEIMMYGEPVKLLVSQWEQLEIKDGLVYCRWAPKAIESEVLQLLVPASHRQDFLKQVHTGITGGHFGVKRTMLQVQRRAFWPNWRRDVKNHCRDSQCCATYFRGQLPRSGELQPLLAGEPFEKLHIDITGPLPRTRR